jgi:hypothetical protein
VNPSAKWQEAMVGSMVAVIAIGFSLSAGLVTGVFAMIAVAVRKEDRQYSLTRPARGVAARGVRRLTGVGMRDVTPSAIWGPAARRVLH